MLSKSPLSKFVLSKSPLSKSALSLSLLLALSCLAPSAMAAKNEGTTISKVEFIQMREDVETEMATGSKYSHLNERDKREVRSKLARMGALLDPVDHSRDLKLKERVALFNLQTDVNGLLTAVQKEDRVTCRREHMVGTHRPVGRCFTAKEREMAANAAREDMIDSLQRGQVKDR